MFQPTVYRASVSCSALRALCGKQLTQSTAVCGLRNPKTPRGVRTEATYAKLLDKALGFKVREHVKVKEKYLDDPLYQKPPRVEKIHGIRVCRVAFHSFQLERIDFYMDFALRAAYHLGIPIAGPVSMPINVRRWTVLKSPFVHKSSMEVFERRTHKRLMVLYDADMEVVKKWLEYVNENIPVGIGMKYWLVEYESLGISEQIEKALRSGDASTVDPDMIKDTKYAQKMARRGRKLLWTSYKDLPTFSRSDVEKLAMNVVEKLRVAPNSNIREVTRSVVSGSKGPREVTHNQQKKVGSTSNRGKKSNAKK
ncbi:mitochondrial 37S ribosomal protein rsm10 [Coemansia sp. RSA 1813]|nr:mitochondrial 37S ribosomal protein rsm10 [Coemansia sp. RSA 1646]KAJ1771488.1 mitochondrial 37S ribosomal protein rsm10 [Coemansia sp. RSA 1843]KAJ2217530.1 mitochondrial 37S ribosomal protein rsm10 [Coemansia sp. RSA 487]KAJ2573459.1 mitochondrial 37S ribosomal protein rsm10 [Coemansia sp. RSA 1813]